MIKYKAYYFNGDKMVSSATIVNQNKANVLESLRQSLMLDSTENLSVELYEEQKVRYYIEQGMSLTITKGSIIVEKDVFKKKLERVNWISELSVSKYYSEEEVQKIQENLQAMMDFVPEETQQDILDENGDVIGQQTITSEFSFPHEIEEKFKEIESKDKEKELVEILQPLQIIQ